MRVSSNEDSYDYKKSRENYFREKYHTDPKKPTYNLDESASEKDDDIYSRVKSLNDRINDFKKIVDKEEYALQSEGESLIKHSESGSPIKVSDNNLEIAGDENGKMSSVENVNSTKDPKD